MKRPVAIVAAILAATAGVAVGVSGYVVSGYERAFERTSNGDSLADVLSRFGEPSVRENPNIPFLRYATSPCRDTCAERLWWEHPILRDIEAWSVEFDAAGRVVRKTHWVSP
jgi:hypothetical protein